MEQFIKLFGSYQNILTKSDIHETLALAYPPYSLRHLADLTVKVLRIPPTNANTRGMRVNPNDFDSFKVHLSKRRLDFFEDLHSYDYSTVLSTDFVAALEEFYPRSHSRRMCELTGSRSHCAFGFEQFTNCDQDHPILFCKQNNFKGCRTTGSAGYVRVWSLQRTEVSSELLANFIRSHEE
jgi:hypothetical protein